MQPDPPGQRTTYQTPFEWLYDGDQYEVLYSVRSPNTDFIFAVPKTHTTIDPTERAFFQIRHRDSNGQPIRAIGYVLDMQELIDIHLGFTMLVRDHLRRAIDEAEGLIPNPDDGAQDGAQAATDRTLMED